MNNTTQTNDEPIKLHEVAGATAIVIAACAGVAICFTTVATCQYVSDLSKRMRKKIARHV